MVTVRKLIDEKAEARIYTIPSNATVFDALLVMCEGNTGAVLVTDDEKIVGIFTERDYAREGEVKGRTARETIVSDVMTSQMVLIKPETTLEECAELMGKYHVRICPCSRRIAWLASSRSDVWLRNCSPNSKVQSSNWRAIFSGLVTANNE